MFGATGDLAKKKLFPALAALINQGLIPSTCKIIGYGRSEMTTEALVADIPKDEPPMPGGHDHGGGMGGMGF